jgi:hypothetical protein
MTFNRMSRIGALVVVVFIACPAACARTSPAVSESDYSTRIVGVWQGKVGASKETMSLGRDGTFVCRLQPMGFISTMIFPTKGGTIRGTWKITGATVVLSLTGETNERVENAKTSSAIVSFRQDELVLKSDRGDTSTFERVGS